MEIVVDAYNEQERALGWYCYLQDRLGFPFAATCIVERDISPLRINDEVEAIGMPNEEECEREVFVSIAWNDGCLAIPLSQLKPVRGLDKTTKMAVEDWHYWFNMGYRF